MVSARIPDEIYSQGVTKLAAIDASVSSLVLSAFEYVMKTGTLPKAEAPLKNQSRVLSKEQVQKYQQFIESSTLSINLPEDFDYKKELVEGKWQDYARLT